VKKPRKHYSGEEKVAILRRHLLEQERFPSSVTSLDCGRRCSTVGRRSCSRTGPPPSSQRPLRPPGEQERIEYLEKKIQRKDEVLAELMGEHIALKKNLGNSERGLGAARRAGPDRGFRAALVGSQ